MQGWNIYWEYTIGKWVSFIEEKDSGWCYVIFLPQGILVVTGILKRGVTRKEQLKKHVCNSRDATIAIVRDFSDKNRGNFAVFLKQTQVGEEQYIHIGVSKNRGT